METEKEVRRFLQKYRQKKIVEQDGFIRVEK
jgi:hypothetical protein